MAIIPDFHTIEGYLSGRESIIVDKGYDNNKHRIYLTSNNNFPVIPGRKNRTQPIEYDKDKFKLWSKIGNFFAIIKENRRLALKYNLC